jgi:hypothetical protein
MTNNPQTPDSTITLAPSDLFPVFGPTEQTLDTATSPIALFSMSNVILRSFLTGMQERVS